MPSYCFKCETCGKLKEVVRQMADSSLPETCTCGMEMVRDYPAESGSVRGDYAEPIISESLAFDAIDLAEHRRRFPDIDVHVEHARCAKPIFRNLTQKRRYLKARGFVDCRSFI